MRILPIGALVLGTFAAHCGGDTAATPTADVGATDTASPDPTEVTASDTSGAPDTSDTGPDVPARTNAFVAEPPAAGPRLELSVTFGVDGDPGLIEVQVVAHAIGAVFGLSYHLSYDPDVLALEGAVTQPAFLGSDADAIHVVAQRPGDLALGGSRRASALGDTPIADALVLGTLHFRASPDAETRLSVTRSYARTADTALVPVSGGRGTLTLAPRAPEAHP